LFNDPLQGGHDLAPQGEEIRWRPVGEAFIHADNGVVYMICEVQLPGQLQPTTLAVTFDGRAALVASELNPDDSVSMVKLEMTRRLLKRIDGFMAAVNELRAKAPTYNT